MKSSRIDVVAGCASVLACCTLSLGFAAIASAQQAPNATSASDASQGVLAEVIVTAEKRAQPLQQVPMSITALTGAQLQNSGALTLADIGRQVPGLSIVSVAPGENTLVLRGISSVGGSAPTVGFYIDDTPIPPTSSNYLPDPVLFDLDRVEVLEGPQGTLYGASSMGGTVKYVTSQPNLHQFQASVKATGSFTEDGGLNNEYDGLINVPLSPTLAVRASAVYRDYSGYIDRRPIDPTNVLEADPDGAVAKDVNTEQTFSGRIALEYQPMQSLSITPWVMYQRTLLGAPFTFDEPPGSFDDPIQVRDTDEPIDNEFTLVSLPIHADLGRVHLVSVTSYYDSYFQADEDESKVAYEYLSPPQTYVYPVPFWNTYHEKYLTEEARATATVGPVQGLLGVYYDHSNTPSYYWMPISAGYNAAFGTPFGSTPFYQQVATHREDDTAAFGQLNIDLTHALQLTLGDRVFGIKQDVTNEANGVFNGGPSGGPQVLSSSEHGTTPKVGLSYHFTRHAMVYADAAKGFRPGSATAPVPQNICGADLSAIGLSSAPSSYSPDSIWDYEVGEKATLEHLGLSLDSALYYIKWNNLQQLILLPTCGFNLTGNFGTAASKGAELQVQYAISRSLLFAVSGSFTQAQLTSTVTGGQGVSGDPLENVPKWMGSVSVDYHRDISPDVSGFAHFDLNTSSRQYNNFVPSSIYYATGGYTLANARLGINTAAWRISFFVSNLLNKHAETALPNSYAINLANSRMVSLNRPRTIGLDLQRDF